MIAIKLFGYGEIVDFRKGRIEHLFKEYSDIKKELVIVAVLSTSDANEFVDTKSSFIEIIDTDVHRGERIFQVLKKDFYEDNIILTIAHQSYSHSVS